MNKKLLNTQILCTSKEQGAEIVQFYIGQGFNTVLCTGHLVGFYYGVDKDGHFVNRFTPLGTILTHPEAKALVADEGQAEFWPDKLMWVWDDRKEPKQRVVFGKKNNMWLAWTLHNNLENVKNIYHCIPWNYTSETKPVPKFTRKYIAEKLGVEDFEIEG